MPRLFVVWLSCAPYQSDLLVFSVFTAWCLRSEGVSSVLLGVSTADQLLENLGALRVLFIFLFSSHSNQCQINNSAWATLGLTNGYAALLLGVIFKTNCHPSFLPRRFYPKWPLKPLLRLMPCWEISHTQRKSCVRKRCKSEWHVLF